MTPKANEQVLGYKCRECDAPIPDDSPWLTASEPEMADLPESKSGRWCSPCWTQAGDEYNYFEKEVGR